MSALIARVQSRRQFRHISFEALVEAAGFTAVLCTIGACCVQAIDKVPADLTATIANVLPTII